ncbi:hypothetical protein [uncultured Croceitalea sp.]|uniref:hypothetical protein n=1 Tax=uncultured Croceitalea sp. TaxID=1798908 RepID=UPI0033067091
MNSANSVLRSSLNIQEAIDQILSSKGYSLKEHNTSNKRFTIPLGFWINNNLNNCYRLILNFKNSWLELEITANKGNNDNKIIWENIIFFPLGSNGQKYIHKEDIISRLNNVL